MRGLLTLTQRSQWAAAQNAAQMVSDVPLYHDLNYDEPDSRVPFQVGRCTADVCAAGYIYQAMCRTFCALLWGQYSV